MSPVPEMTDPWGEMYFLQESPAGNGWVNTYVSWYVYLPMLDNMLFHMVEFQTSLDFKPVFTLFHEFCEIIFALIL